MLATEADGGDGGMRQRGVWEDERLCEQRRRTWVVGRGTEGCHEVAEDYSLAGLVYPAGMGWGHSCSPRCWGRTSHCLESFEAQISHPEALRSIWGSS